jgi:hypothetical protein
VVIFSPEPPLADPAAVESLALLAQEATVTWVVPWSARKLISPDFLRHAKITTDYESVADDVAALVGGDEAAGKGAAADDHADDEPARPVPLAENQG